MALVLTESSRVTCATHGTTSTSGQPKLKVRGASVLRLDGIVGASIIGCAVENSSSTKKCTTVVSASGTAAKLLVAGAPVALDTLTGQSDGTTPAISATANQSLLKAS